MASDFNKPVTTDAFADVLTIIRDNDKASALMFSGISASNIPVGAVQFAGGVFNTWSGTAWGAVPIGVGGGGTGSTTAAGARVALGTNDAANITTGTVAVARLPVGTTSAQGIVQLNNTVTSTSASQAATANAVKTAYDKIYFNSSVLDFVDDVAGGSPFSNGSLSVCRVGDIVTLTILTGNSGGVLILPNSSALLDQILPSWAMPVQATKSLYEWSGTPRMINVSTNGSVSFIFYDWAGALVSQGVTGLTSISYIGAAL